MAGFFKNLYNKVANRADVDWDELEAYLIAADLGVRTSLEIVENLRNLGRKISADDVVEAASMSVGRSWRQQERVSVATLARHR